MISANPILASTRYSAIVTYLTARNLEKPLPPPIRAIVLSFLSVTYEEQDLKTKKDILDREWSTLAKSPLGQSIVLATPLFMFARRFASIPSFEQILLCIHHLPIGGQQLLDLPQTSFYNAPDKTFAEVEEEALEAYFPKCVPNFSVLACFIINHGICCARIDLLRENREDFLFRLPFTAVDGRFSILEITRTERHQEISYEKSVT